MMEKLKPYLAWVALAGGLAISTVLFIVQDGPRKLWWAIPAVFFLYLIADKVTTKPNG
jgi:hypothetical protein